MFNHKEDMAIVTINKDNYWDTINRACSILKDGGIVIYPTETFYGIGARYDSERALNRILELKQRPTEKTFPLIIDSKENLHTITSSVNDIERLMIEEFWPGPLTLLLQAREGLLTLIQHQGYVAVRMSSNRIARDITKTLGCPITTTSANVSSQPPSVDAETVWGYFGNGVDMIIDDGPTQGGLPSTIAAVHKGVIEIVRKGCLDLEGFCKRMGLAVCYK